MHAVAERTIRRGGPAWHCCPRVHRWRPACHRLTGCAADATRLRHEEIFGRLAVHDLPPGERGALLKAAVQDGLAGGRIYDAHIAEVARAAGAEVIVTDNRRHFLSALRYGIRVDTTAEFAATLKARR